MHGAEKRGIGDDAIREGDIGARFELIVGFGGLIDPDGEAGERLRPLEHVNLRAKHGRDGDDVRIGPERAKNRTRTVDRRLRIHRQRAFGRDAELKVLHQQKPPEGLPHAAPQHDHVEEQRPRDRNTEDGERSTSGMPPERGGREDADHRPNRVSGGVRTSRVAAKYPALTPSTMASTTATTTMCDVTSANASGVRYTAR